MALKFGAIVAPTAATVEILMNARREWADS
jgi:hypothetical protein